MNTLRTYTRKVFMILAALLLPGVSLLAQEAEAAVAQPIPNLLLWAMAGMICILAIVIAAMAALLRTGLQLKFGKDKKTNDTTGPSRVLPLLLFFLLMGGSHALSAQETQTAVETAATGTADYGGMHPGLFYGFAVVILLLLTLIGLLYRAIMMVLKPQVEEVPVKAKPGFLEKLNASVAIEKEQDIMLDHDYDGIHELDNNLPPWWKYGFYLTILFACIYLWRFHVSESAMLQQAEYEEQVATAEAEVAAYKEKMGNLVDENSVTALAEASSIGNGKTLFTANCAACHGQLGEGGVGPNLTDVYWLHGGGIKNIFKTIKYGWPQKGMKSWEKDLGAKQIQEIASYILTLQGSNPPHAKEQQGDPWEETPAPADSASAKVTALN